MNKNLRNALKAFILLVCFSLLKNETNAQTFDNGIFFQALARDNYANPAKDRKIYVQSTIIQSTINGTKVLMEEYQTTTDATGVFGISIGKGTRTGGSLSALNNIDWSAGPYFLNLKISITPVAPLESWNYSKDWVDLGTTSFGTVPYALYAKSVAGFDTKVNVSDTANMLLPYAKAQALALVQNTVNAKLNTADSLLKYVTPNQLANNKFDTTTLSNRIELKADLSNLSTVATSGSFNDLTNKPTGYVTSVGNVSGSSNANGAVITSGALNLTPADGTNGGIITNGTQTIAGNKTLNGTTTFSNNIYVKGLGLGLGAGNQSTFFGAASSANGNNSTAIGFMSQNGNTGLNNTSVGSNTLRNTSTGSYNTVVGSEAGQVIASYNTFIGASTNGAAAVSNATALGYGAYSTESNSIQLGANGYNGTTPITKVKTSGTITAGAITYPNTGGSNGQVLTTNGSVASWVTPSTITVGTISNTSNVNGATISAGALSLAPADASNGGIVTNGAQTFAGDKTFNGSLNVQAVLAPSNLDLNTYTSYSTYYAAPGQDSRQTFTQATSGYLTKLTLYSLSNVSGVTIEIYKGGDITSQNSIGGTLLYTSSPINFTSGVNIDILINNGLKLDAGQTYMFRVISSATLTIGYGYTGPGNPPGNPGLTYSWPSYYAGLSHAYAFKTYISQKSGGDIVVSGKTVLSTATIEASELNNYNVSNISTLFVKPASSWTNIYGLSGGVLGQVIRIFSVNNQTANCCTGLSLLDYSSGSNTGTQKIVAPGGKNIDSNQGAELVFDGTYWRIVKIGM